MIIGSSVVLDGGFNQCKSDVAFGTIAMQSATSRGTCRNRRK